MYTYKLVHLLVVSLPWPTHAIQKKNPTYPQLTIFLKSLDASPEILSHPELCWVLLKSLLKLDLTHSVSFYCAMFSPRSHNCLCHVFAMLITSIKFSPFPWLSFILLCTLAILYRSMIFIVRFYLPRFPCSGFTMPWTVTRLYCFPFSGPYSCNWLAHIFLLCHVFPFICVMFSPSSASCFFSMLSQLTRVPFPHDSCCVLSAIHVPCFNPWLVSLSQSTGDSSIPLFSPLPFQLQRSWWKLGVAGKWVWLQC